MKNHTVQEVADIFRRHPRTIYRWIAEGKTFQILLKVKDGYLIPEKEIERIMAKGVLPDDIP